MPALSFAILGIISVQLYSKGHGSFLNTDNNVFVSYPSGLNPQHTHG